MQSRRRSRRRTGNNDRWRLRSPQLPAWDVRHCVSWSGHTFLSDHAMTWGEGRSGIVPNEIPSNQPLRKAPNERPYKKPGWRQTLRNFEYPLFPERVVFHPLILYHHSMSKNSCFLGNICFLPRVLIYIKNKLNRHKNCFYCLQWLVSLNL